MQAIKTAQLNLKRQMLAVVKKAAVTHWQAAMTLLERKFPDEFAQRTKQEITGYLAKSEDEADKKARLSRVTKRINEMLEEKLLEGPQEQPAVVQNSEQILP